MISREAEENVTDNITPSNSKNDTKPIQPPRSNPWSIQTIDNNNDTHNDNNAVKSFQYIMFQQQQEQGQMEIQKKQEEKEKQQEKEAKETKEIMEQIKQIETEEERMIRMAIEASLQHSNTPTLPYASASSAIASSVASAAAPATASAATGGYEHIFDKDEMDEDMKLAIRLSMQDSNIHSSLSTGNAKDPHQYKTELIDNDSKPLSTMATKTNVATRLPVTFSESFEIISPEEVSEIDGTRLPTALLDTPAGTFEKISPEEASELDETRLPVVLPDSPAENFEKILPAEVSELGETRVPVVLTNTPGKSVATVHSSFISKEEEDQIAAAIMEAEDAEIALSLKLAMELEEEERQKHDLYLSQKKRENSSGASNIRTISRSEFLMYKNNVFSSDRQDEEEGQSNKLWGKDDYEEHQNHYNYDIKSQQAEDYQLGQEYRSGFQINSSTPSKTWSRLDNNSIIGPNNEIRTKHDVTLKNQANADQIIGLKSMSSAKRCKDEGGKISVSDVAYNNYQKSVKNATKRSIVKGVAAHGTGRAENMNAERTRGGAMDGNVRLLISKAITNGLIQYCNGVVKEGKEAIVYHADGGDESGGIDVAVKVFKRIQEFKGRGKYMDGDPRYYGKKFRNIDKREQVELWTEKEYRNLIRANKAGVPVPTPIMQKENVLFMRFLGEGGWPAPQLREVELKKGSKKWTALYCQTLVAVRRLYHCARLVHGDLSEYNILVCPMMQVENALDKSEEAKDVLQIVLIDFGQAVEIRHPSAHSLLLHDLEHVQIFFKKQGIMTVTLEDCEQFILKEFDATVDDDNDDCEEKEEDLHSTGTEDNDTPLWRYAINGWDDMKDIEWIENKLSTMKVQIAN